MNQSKRMMSVVMLAATLVACNKSQPPATPEGAQPADAVSEPVPATEPVEPAPTAPATTATTPAGSMVVYACDDGSGVTVTYDKNSALVKLPTGSTTLSRADPESPLGPNAYLSEEMTLSRNGNGVRLQVAGKSHTCTGS